MAQSNVTVGPPICHTDYADTLRQTFRLTTLHTLHETGVNLYKMIYNEQCI